MAISIEKGLIGREDTAWDNTGSNSTYPRKTSDGSFKEFSKVNASHIPTTTATRAKVVADASTTLDANVDDSLATLADSLTGIGVPDDSTLENSSGTLQIKDDGVTTAKIAAGNITATELGTDAVETAKINDGAVVLAKMAVNSVDSDQYVDGSIDTIHLANSAVSTAKIADADGGSNGVTKAKLDMDGSGTAPVMFPIYTGTHSLAGGAAFETLATDSGAQSGDLVMANVRSVTNAVYLKTAVVSTGEITYTFSADPGVSSIGYIIFRATS